MMISRVRRLSPTPPFFGLRSEDRATHVALHVVTFLVSARVLYGLWRSWTAAEAGVYGTPMVLAFGIPESLAAAGTVIGYYVAYGLGVRRRILKWQNRALPAR
jgi:hypothetical protein